MTGNPLVLGRLVWRAASLGLLLLALLSAGVAVAARLDAFEAQLVDEGTLWSLAALVPAAIGFGLTLITVEAQHTQFAWSLPRLRDGLRAGKLVVMALAAGLVGWVAIASVPGMAVAAVGVGALCFALGGVVSDPLSSKLESRGVLVILVFLALRPQLLGWAASVQPIAAGLIAAAFALLLLRREFAVDRARERPFVAAMPIGDTTESTRRAYWARTKSPEGMWSRSLSGARTTDWLHAANYEVFGGTPGGYLGRLLIQFVFVGGLAYYLGTPGMVAYIPPIIVSWMGLQLQGRFLYPVSRTARARLLFWGSVVEMVTLFAFAAAALGVMHAAGPRAGIEPDGSPGGAIRMALVIFALAPIGHWARVGRPLMSEQFASLRHTVTALAMMALWIFASLVILDVGKDLAPAPLAVFIAALAVTTYTTYWLALRWYHARRDIVFIPAG